MHKIELSFMFIVWLLFIVIITVCTKITTNEKQSIEVSFSMLYMSKKDK